MNVERKNCNYAFSYARIIGIRSEGMISADFSVSTPELISVIVIIFKLSLTLGSVTVKLRLGIRMLC